jgi:hypothetical protein
VTTLSISDAGICKLNVAQVLHGIEPIAPRAMAEAAKVWRQIAVPSEHGERYASHLDATRSGSLAKFTAMRRASSRVSCLLMAGLCCSSSK